MVPLAYYLVLSAILFTIGIYGVLSRRNAIIVLMSIEMMMNAININFIAFSAYGNGLSGQAFTLFLIAIAAGEVAVGLAILLSLYRKRGTIDLRQIRLLRW
jgi:NADH:ubiquinone oxidoreductase subunit K